MAAWGRSSRQRNATLAYGTRAHASYGPGESYGKHGRSSPSCMLPRVPHSRTPPIYLWKLMGLGEYKED